MNKTKQKQKDFYQLTFHTNGKLIMYKKVCSRYYAFYSSCTDEQAESREKLTASIVDVPVELVDPFCQRML